jgi:hypothetical protein
VSRQEREDLMEFFKALNGTIPPDVGPPPTAGEQTSN